MKTIIHVNQNKIRSNIKACTLEPVITVKTYKSNRYAKTVSIYDEFGNLIGRLRYSPKKPLKCGARVWLEVYEQGRVVIDE